MKTLKWYCQEHVDGRFMIIDERDNILAVKPTKREAVIAGLFHASQRRIAVQIVEKKTSIDPAPGQN